MLLSRQKERKKIASKGKIKRSCSGSREPPGRVAHVCAQPCTRMCGAPGGWKMRSARCHTLLFVDFAAVGLNRKISTSIQHLAGPDTSWERGPGAARPLPSPPAAPHHGWGGGSQKRWFLPPKVERGQIWGWRRGVRGVKVVALGFRWLEHPLVLVHPLGSILILAFFLGAGTRREGGPGGKKKARICRKKHKKSSGCCPTGYISSLKLGTGHPFVPLLPFPHLPPR